MMSKYFTHIGFAALFLLWMTGCSMDALNTKPSKPPPRADVQAQQSAARGDNQGAAQEYLRLAAQTQPPQRDEYWMTAIEYFLRGQRLLDAKTQLSRLQSQQPDIRGRMQLAYAQIALAEKQPDRALELLKLLQVGALTPRSQVSYYYLQALAYEAKKETVKAIYARVSLDPLLGDAYAQNSNHESLWRALLSLSPSQLKQLPAPAPAQLPGWATLALLTQTTAQAQLPQAVQNWRARYPQHPAEKQIVINLLAGHTYNTSNTSAPVAQVKHIALFLPLSGKFKGPAEMVRDGFVTAWYGHQGNKPSVKLYDVDENNVVTAYQQALQKGAQMVVGPMGKNAATALAQAYGDFPVPTLLLFELDELNSPGLRTPKNLFQFSLSPEAEARQAAEKAWLDGHRLAAIMTPKGTWGSRLQSAFATHWERLGGQVVSRSQYSKAHLAGAVREAAHSGADAFFLASFPVQARRIKPQLNYYGRGRTPLYATSHSYSTEPAQKADKDLNGLQFVDMPWVLLQGFWPDRSGDEAQEHTLQPAPAAMYLSLKEYWPKRMYGSNKRLFAFGIDAYHVIEYLQTATQQRGRDFHLKGATGLLSVNQRGVVQRRLLWAKFRGGMARLQADSNAEEMSGASIPAGYSSTQQRVQRMSP